MGQVRVESFAISLDGYGAGPDQDINNGLGVGGEDLHQWFIPTRTFQRPRCGRWHDRGRRRFCRAGIPEHRSVDSGEEHVRTDSRSLARFEMEGLVG